MIFYFDAYKDQFGVEAIRRVLKKADREFVTSRGYRKATTRAGVSGRRVDARYLVSVPDNGDSRWSRYGLPAL